MGFAEVVRMLFFIYLPFLIFIAFELLTNSINIKEDLAVLMFFSIGVASALNGFLIYDTFRKIEKKKLESEGI